MVIPCQQTAPLVSLPEKHSQATIPSLGFLPKKNTHTHYPIWSYLTPNSIEKMRGNQKPRNDLWENREPSHKQHTIFPLLEQQHKFFSYTFPSQTSRQPILPLATALSLSHTPEFLHGAPPLTSINASNSSCLHSQLARDLRSQLPPL